MSVLNTVLLIVMAISAVFTVILILMHSGKGTGVSDLIASSMYNSSAGSGVWEKNLDRLTILFAVIFGVCICIMTITFPTATLTYF